jgi:hypothetical protein
MVVRPIWVITIAVAVVELFRGSWWALGGCCIGVLLINGVGSGLHPLQSSHDLSQGPLNGPGAIREAAILTTADQLVLVSQACTKFAILVGITLIVVFLAIAHWHWYWAVLAAWFGCVIVGGGLKFAFHHHMKPDAD